MILVALIDRIRMLDNDMIRLQQKVSVVLQLHEDHRQNEMQNKIRNSKNSNP